MDTQKLQINILLCIEISSNMIVSLSNHVPEAEKDRERERQRVYVRERECEREGEGER